MKKISFLSLVVSVFCFIACDNDNTPSETPLDIEKGSYVGKLAVEQSDGSTYEGEEVWFTITKTSNNTMEILMKDVTFSDKMPFTINMTIKGIITEADSKEISLYGEDILPVYNGNEVETYRVTNLRGTLTEGYLTLSMTCGDYPLTFSGIAGDIEEFILDETEYVGTMEVDQNDGTIYIQEEITVLLTETENNTIEMLMENVGFSDKMPIKLDMTIRDIVIESKNEDEIIISGEGLIPYAMNGPFPAYTITELTGTITDKIIEFSMMCGEYPLSFSGTIRK